MNLKIERETLSVNEKIFDGVGEQSVELDYILPDYYPDIFKLIRCSIVPVITSHSVNGDTLSYEMTADVKILYSAEGSGQLQCISQRLTYSKSVNLGEAPTSPDIYIRPKSDHINCRAVNKRRIDMRGAVSIKITVKGESRQEAISDVLGMNVQTKKVPVEYMAKRINAQRVLTVSDDMELPNTKPAVNDIVRTEISLTDTESKIISNKLVVKGEAGIKVLYTCKEGMETMSFTVPYSQIVDMDGIDESFKCYVTAEGVCCDITPSADENGENRTLKYELKLSVRCCAYKTVPVQLVSDAYSTAYPCEYACTELAAPQPPVMISEKFQSKLTLENDESGISGVYDVWCTAKNINLTLDSENKIIKISGMLCCQAMIKNDNDLVNVLEKDQAFEFEINSDEMTDSSSAELNIPKIECSYNLTDMNSISVKADIYVIGELYTSSCFKAVTDITVDDSVKITRDGDYAIKLYYGVKDEDIWNIAKKYSTSVSAIMEENSLESEALTDNGMLLIPIV